MINKCIICGREAEKEEMTCAKPKCRREYRNLDRSLEQLEKEEVPIVLEKQ